MRKQGIIAIDQGTTSSRALLFSLAGEVLAVHQVELELVMPELGWVEQDPQQIWRDVQECVQHVLRRADDLGVEVVSIGVTNQRETSVIWDKETGAPVYNAIVWQDRRTAEMCAQLKEQGHERGVRAKTGLLLDPYFSATKIAWMLDHVEGARMRAEAGDLLFGTIDSFLIWHLTGGERHLTDVTNASRTMLYNIQEQAWDDELLAMFDVPRTLLPEVCENAHDFGQTAAGVFEQRYPIGGVAGDQQAALIGQACFEKGMMKSTYGTGCFALCHTGADFQLSDNRLLSTVAYKINGEISYALEGSIFVAGSLVQWLRDGLGLFDNAAQTQEMAESVDDHGGVYIVPALTGLGAPYWQPEATGMITGIRRDTSDAHLVRAALEAQAYQTHDLVEAMVSDGGGVISALRVDGGLVANDFVCQFMADILDIRIEVPVHQEATAWGAACLAGLQAGVFGGLDDIAAAWGVRKTFTPSMGAQDRARLLEGWHSAVGQCLSPFSIQQ